MVRAQINSLLQRKNFLIAILITAIICGGLFIIFKSSQDISRYLVSADTFNDPSVKLDLSASEILSANNRDKIYKDDSIHSDIKTADKRVYVLDQYFLSRKSPLYGNAKHFVGACIKYDAPEDCIVAVAIASNETHLCTYHNSAQMHNCWGWGGAGKNRVTFPDFRTAIYRVVEVLVKNYGIDSMNNPSLMEGRFCGPQDECKNWGSAIKIQMNQIEEYSKSIGMGSLYELRRER